MSQMWTDTQTDTQTETDVNPTSRYSTGFSINHTKSNDDKCSPGPKKSIVLTEINPENAKRSDSRQ